MKVGRGPAVPGGPRRARGHGHRRDRRVLPPADRPRHRPPGPPPRGADQGGDRRHEPAGVPVDDRARGRRQAVDGGGERLRAVGAVEQQALGVQRERRPLALPGRRRAEAGAARVEQLQPAGCRGGRAEQRRAAAGQLVDVRGDRVRWAAHGHAEDARGDVRGREPGEQPGAAAAGADAEHDQRRGLGALVEQLGRRRGEPDRAQRGGAAAGHAVGGCGRRRTARRPGRRPARRSPCGRRRRSGAAGRPRPGRAPCSGRPPGRRRRGARSPAPRRGRPARRRRRSWSSARRR